MREKYESLALVDLKAIARTRGIKGTSLMKKGEVVEAMLDLDAKEKEAKETKEKASAETMVARGESAERKNAEPMEEGEKTMVRKNPADLSELDSGIEARGILEVMPDGFGFIR